MLKTPSDKQYDVITVGAFDQEGFSVAETILLVTEIVSDFVQDNVIETDDEKETAILATNEKYEMFFIMVICIGILILGLQFYDILYRRRSSGFHYTMMNSK